MSSVSRGFFFFPGLAFALGTWQVYRWDRKQKMLAYREQRRIAEAVPLGEQVDAEEMEFRRVKARGRFDHHYELKVGPKSYEGESGFFVLTPLLLDSGKRVMVNRGWVPRDGEESIKRPEGEVELTGVVRKAEDFGRAWFVPENRPAEKVFHWMEIGAMKSVCGGLDYDVRLDAVRSDKREEEPPIGGQTVYWMPNNHLTYIATWYGLAAALAVMTVRARRRPLPK